MRSVVWVLTVSILFMLVAAGLNISNQGINDLTLNNPGYVIAVHLEQEEVYIEALGNRYLCSQGLVRQGQERLDNLGAAFKTSAEVVMRHGQAQFDRTTVWLQNTAWKKVRQWFPL